MNKTHRALAVAVSLSLSAAVAAPRTAVCDVCREGEEFVAAQIPHGDHTHSFCSDACAAAYRANPAQYHAAAGPAPKAPAHAHADARAGSSAGSGSAAPS